MRAKSHVKVFVRTKPSPRPYEGLKTSKDGQSITVTFPKQDEGVINNQLESLTFKFDGVLENVSQDVVYNNCVHEAVDSSLSGYNSTVFAYGQTGAGKTFTMSGDARSYSHRGIIPRALQHVFRELDMRSDRIYSISVSYLEIYNEALRDLLAEDPAASDSLAILDDAATTVVRGLTKVPVSTEEEALRQFFLGEQARSTAQHALNNNSSRSHVLFTLHIEMRASAEAEERALLSKLHLVDLAGSERIKKTQAAAGAGDANYEQLRESSCINKSLSFLEQVVNALARGDAHVPFRQSKLTAALRDAIGGNSNTVMLANLWPEETHLEECVSTLRFASRMRCLQTDAQVNESGDPLLALKKAERQIKELRQELAMRDMLAGRGRIVYEDLSDGERLELQQLVLRYLSGAADLDELPTDSLKRIRETYKAFKAVSSTWAAAAAQGDAARISQHSATGAGGADDLEAAGVGDVDVAASAGFCIGTAPLFARPPPATQQGHGTAHGTAAGEAGSSSRSSSSPVPGAAAQLASQSKQQQQQHAMLQQQQVQQQRPGTQQSSRPGTRGAAGASQGTDAGAEFGGDADRNALFSKYKHGIAQGSQQAEAVRQQQQLVAQLKQELKEGGYEVNAAKADIDHLNQQLESKKQQAANTAAAAGSTGGEPGVLDDEHYQLLQQLKAAKARYRSLYEGLQEARSSCDAAVDGLAAAKEALLAGFDAWHSTQHQQVQPTGQIPAWRPVGDGGDDEDLDPSEVFERAELARKAAAAGDPSSAAFYAAKKHTSKVLNAKQPGGGAR